MSQAPSATTEAPKQATSPNQAPSATNQEAIEAIKAAGIKMPPCPQVLLDLQQVLQDPDSGNQVVSRLIGRDIKLGAAVFKTANSAGFARRRKFTTIDQAVAVIGRKAIANIVKAAALRLSLGGPDPRLDGFWSRAMDIAMLCSIVAEMAPNSRNISADDAFTAGLFHDCGVAVLIQRFRGYCDAFADRKKPPPEIPEQDKVIRISHCAVGELVAREWSLPDYVHETIRCHHWPLELVPKVAVPATATLFMGTHMAKVKAKLPDTAWPEHCLTVMAELGLAEDALEEFETEVWDSFEMFH